MLGATRRGDFALFQQRIGERPLIYLDSAASTPSPASVLACEHAARQSLVANVHRGHHALSEEASAAYDGARRRVARFLGAEPRCVVFCRGATEGLNLVAQGLRLNRADLVLTTLSEHHSNLVPWLRAANVRFLESDPLRAIEPAELEAAIRSHRPKVFAFQHASNVTGVIQPVSALCEVARRCGVLTVVDAAQSAPHLPLDVDALGCDFLTFSGHKLLGPKGIGVLWGRYELLAQLEPLVLGGGAVLKVTREGYSVLPPPEGLEAGTPNVIGAIALGAAMDYLDELGRDAIAAHGAKLACQLRLLARELPGVTALCAQGGSALPIASLVPRAGALGADQLATLLSDTFGIMVRSGLQCAHPLFSTLASGTGALRASAYLYNTEEELGHFFESVARVMKRFSS